MEKKKNDYRWSDENMPSRGFNTVEEAEAYMKKWRKKMGESPKENTDKKKSK